MGFFENILIALNGIRSNKMRSFLTMLGIIIGISAVITITTIGSSLKSTLAGTLNELGGLNNIYLFIDAKYPETDEEWDTWEYPEIDGEEDLISIEDMSEFKEEYPDSVKYININQYVASGKISENSEDYVCVDVKGISEGSFESIGANVIDGREINQRDIDEKRNVCLISDMAAEVYFGDKNPIGQQIEFFDDTESVSGKFAIIGIYEYNEAIMGKPDMSLDEKDRFSDMYIPVSVISSISNTDTYEGFSYFEIAVKSNTDATAFSETAREYFNQIFEERNNSDWNIEVYTVAEELSSINKVLDVLTIAISVIAVISLIVGGVGVMNIMLVSITERTKEIGIRKALGAKNFSIKMQFIVEAIVICVIGGAIGIVSGIINGFVIAKIAEQFIKNSEDYQFITVSVSPSVTAIIISVVFSMLTGVFFGYYPAKKAAAMNPIDALRYE